MSEIWLSSTQLTSRLVERRCSNSLKTRNWAVTCGIRCLRKSCVHGTRVRDERVTYVSEIGSMAPSNSRSNISTDAQGWYSQRSSGGWSRQVNVGSDGSGDGPPMTSSRSPLLKPVGRSPTALYLAVSTTRLGSVGSTVSMIAVPSRSDGHAQGPGATSQLHVAGSPVMASSSMHFSSTTDGSSPTGGTRVPAFEANMQLPRMQSAFELQGKPLFGLFWAPEQILPQLVPPKPPGHGRLEFPNPSKALNTTGWLGVRMMSKLISIQPCAQVPVTMFTGSKQSPEVWHAC